MSTNTKPRICEVLGVEVGERFGNGVFEYEITPDGRMMWFSNCGRGESTAKSLIDLINHPESIIRKPRFTEDEVALCRLLVGTYDWAQYIARTENCLYYTELSPQFTESLFFRSGTTGRCTALPKEFLPSLLPGRRVELAEVIGDTK